MKQIEGLPIYEAVFGEGDEGMLMISLVDCPATMVDFVAFDEDKPVMKYSIDNEEKRIVKGLVMAADTPIYRRDDYMGEFYITHSPEFLRQMAEKYFKDGYQENVDTNHSFELVEGCNMLEFFIKDSENGIVPKGFEDVKDGSLFASYHIVNDEIWEQVKNGTYKGFSLAGIYSIKPSEDDNNIKKSYSKMSKITKIVRDALLKFGQMDTDKGTLYWEGEEELAEGFEVYVQDENGDKQPLADGEYVADGKIITVVNGIVETIKEDVKEEEVKEEEVKEEIVAEEEVKEEKVKEEIVEEEPKEDERDARIAELEAKVAELEAERDELKAKVAELEKEPAAEPAPKEYEAHTTIKKTGDKKLDKAIALVSAFKK